MRAAFFALALSVSCAPASATKSAQTPQDPLPTPISASAPAPSTPTPSAQEQALQDRLQAALAYVSQVRQLPAKATVRGRLIGRAEIEAYLNAQLDEETPRDVLQATEALLIGLGLVPDDFDYRASVIALMKAQLLGFYDPKQKTFFVAGDLSGDDADVTLWHELVHALQDQHYDLSHIGDWEPDLGDSQAAVHALAEGDATSVMLDAMLKPRGTTALDVPESLLQAQNVLGAAAADAPAILVRSLLAPYVDGLAFTNYLRRRGGYAAVDEAWRTPPISTEQLLHPEKFLAHEPPRVVAVPVPPAQAPELAERFHDVMGEQTLRLLLEEWLPARTAAAAASDWGGDRLAVFSDSSHERWAVAWHLRFDTPSAAARAFVAWDRSSPLTDRGVTGSLVAATPPSRRPSDKVCRPRHSHGSLAIVRHGADIAITVGPFKRTANAVSADPDCFASLKWAEAILRP